MFLRFSVEEQELEKRSLVMYKRFIVLLGISLGSHVPAAGQTLAVQTPGVQIVLAHAYVAPAITSSRISLLREQVPSGGVKHNKISHQKKAMEGLK